MSIRRIRSALKEARCEYSIHAREEMDEDQLVDSDVYEAIMKGKVVARLTGDPRVCPRCGQRYFSARVVREMDRLMRERPPHTPKVSVPVIAFSLAA